jgi:Cu(I)/Ag(I) efflux system membrane fusion protein
MKQFILLIAVLLGLSVVVLAAEPADHDHADTVWTCSMHPQIQLPEPGQCPICFMDLIEVPQVKPGAEPQSLRQISFDERARKLAQVEVTPVVYADSTVHTRLVGKVEYDESSMGRIAAWVSGRIDRLDVGYTGAVVKKGQVMAQIYSPELLTAQAELIQASTSFETAQGSSNDLVRQSGKRILESSKQKLRLLGLSADQIQQVLRAETPADHMNITAPMGGIVISKDVVEGAYVKTGTNLFTIADLRRLWVVLEAYEADLSRITLGQDVEFSVEAFPGQEFHGVVAYIDPLVNKTSRTVGVRLNVDNSDGRLIPGMFVQAQVAEKVNTATQTLIIPASAPLLTGKRALVYVELKEGLYEGREVVLGPRIGDFYEVRFGLAEGEKVVSRGGFKIDSAIQIQARPSMMNVYNGSPVSEEPLPGLFLSRLHILQTQFTLLSDQVHSGDVEGAMGSVKKMQGSLEELPVDDTLGDSKQPWQEMRMTLGADLFLLARAENKQDLAHMYAETAVHFHALTTHFSLGTTVQRSSSAALRTAGAVFISHYLELQAALAGDDEGGAREIIKHLEGSLPALLAAMTTDAELAPSALALQQQITALRSVQSLQHIREEFYPLSQTLATLLTQVDLPVATPLYENFCPMAFGNQGATWIAGSDQINNPYFGSMMLRCGEVRRQLQD